MLNTVVMPGSPWIKNLLKVNNSNEEFQFDGGWFPDIWFELQVWKILK